jgi:hypothetical protein
VDILGTLGHLDDLLDSLEPLIFVSTILYDLDDWVGESELELVVATVNLL